MLDKTDLEILDAAIELGEGDQSDLMVCPYCRGGSSGERSLTINKQPLGILYNCFRASCGAKGFVPSNPNSEVVDKQIPKKERPKSKPFRRETRDLGEREVRFFHEEYELDSLTIRDSGYKYCEEMGRIIKPVFNILGYVIGHNARYYPELDNGNANPEPKTILYPEMTNSPLVHFPAPLKGNSSILDVVLVEDMLSSLKIHQLGVNSIALLGTQISDKVLGHLLDLGVTDVDIFLDPDAHDKAIKLSKDLGIMFRSVNVIMGEADPKDLSLQELQRMLVDKYAFD